jgi:hypothetical protein
LILSGGNRRDVEQIGASLTTTNDVLGRSFASSALFTTAVNDKLTNINLTSVGIEIEPLKNFTLQTGFTYRTLETASRTFNLNYFTDIENGIFRGDLDQSEAYFQIDYTPSRKTIGYGVERTFVDNNYSRFFVNFSKGMKGPFGSDFNYEKVQLYFKQPANIGGFGRMFFITELGKTFGDVPLGLLSVVPGNPTYFLIENTFNNLNFYEFVTDTYATFQLEHHFNGRLFSRIPLLREMNLREIVGVKGVYGSISDANRALNASDLTYLAPENGYWEYSAGIGNIFKVFRLDVYWRGTYRSLPDANKFAIKGSFGFYF